jgi:hypothetical protein
VVGGSSSRSSWSWRSSWFVDVRWLGCSFGCLGSLGYDDGCDHPPESSPSHDTKAAFVRDLTAVGDVVWEAEPDRRQPLTAPVGTPVRPVQDESEALWAPTSVSSAGGTGTNGQT